MALIYVSFPESQYCEIQGPVLGKTMGDFFTPSQLFALYSLAEGKMFPGQFQLEFSKSYT